MKYILIVTLFICIITGKVFSQSQHEVLPDRNGGKILKGIISRDLVEKDTSYKWYTANLTGYTPNEGALSAIRKNIDSIQFLVFMGTWCEDSHVIIPKFFSLLDAAGYPGGKVSLIGVDRSKKTLGHLTEALGIINVPTILVMKNGKEMGRVVEYGKSGIFDKDLGEIITSSSIISR